MLKKAAVVGFAGLMLGVSPANAGSIGNSETVALSMIGGGGLMSIGCMAIALLTEDAEEGYDRKGFYAGMAGSYARENFSDSTVTNLVDGELQDNLRRLRGTPTQTDPPTDPPTYINPGIYTFSLSDIDSDTFGFTGRGGYRCHPYISAELQFEQLANFNGSIIETDIPTNDKVRNFGLELESLVFTSNAKAYLLTGRYQPFALAGLGFMRMETKAPDETSTLGTIPRFAGQASNVVVKVALRFGGGLDFYLTENIVMTAEGSYVLPTGKLDGLDYYTFGLGLQYRF